MLEHLASRNLSNHRAGGLDSPDGRDAYLGSRGGPNNSAAEELRGILNSGHDRGTAFVIRLVLVGDDNFRLSVPN